MTKHIQTIYTVENSVFAKHTNAWLESKGFQVLPFQEDGKNIDTIDALVIFHDNHNFDKTTNDLRDLAEKHQIPIHKIDLSGTMSVALSYLSLFFERTKCKHALFLGADELKDLPKMEQFKENWNL
jgi:hypothetical protein